MGSVGVDISSEVVLSFGFVVAPGVALSSGGFISLAVVTFTGVAASP